MCLYLHLSHSKGPEKLGLDLILRGQNLTQLVAPSFVYTVIKIKRITVVLFLKIVFY